MQQHKVPIGKHTIDEVHGGTKVYAVVIGIAGRVVIAKQHMWERELIRADPECHETGHHGRRDSDEPRSFSSPQERR